jgi:hypothetical protein
MLTIGTGARKERIKVAAVGTAGANGSGLTLAAPLRFDHQAGIDVSDPGTGITFAPATRFAHVSGDAVQALGSGIALDRPLTRSHAHGAPVRPAGETTAGYQGSPAPHQWFGSALAGRAGALALVDARGRLVDGLVYGSQQSSSSGNGTIARPDIATLEGNQRAGGCIAVVPSVGRGGAPPPGNRSIGRFSDGADADSLCEDFGTQATTTLASASAAGAGNIKVTSVADFAAGQAITLDSGAQVETAVIAAVGTAGAGVLNAATVAGATSIVISNGAGLSAGQHVTIDSAGNREAAIIVSIGGGRGGPTTATLRDPLMFAHAAGSDVSGTGITLTTPLLLAHGSGTLVSNGTPTPGAANKYYRTRR